MMWRGQWHQGLRAGPDVVMLGCVADAGGHGRGDGSERLVGIELWRRLVRHDLFTPGLLHLRPVGGPQCLAHGLQALGDGQRLLGRPVLGHGRRGRSRKKRRKIMRQWLSTITKAISGRRARPIVRWPK